jgi:hypothetical protein
MLPPQANMVGAWLEAAHHTDLPQLVQALEGDELYVKRGVLALQ